MSDEYEQDLETFSFDKLNRMEEDLETERDHLEEAQSNIQDTFEGQGEGSIHKLHSLGKLFCNSFTNSQQNASCLDFVNRLAQPKDDNNNISGVLNRMNEFMRKEVEADEDERQLDMIDEQQEDLLAKKLNSSGSAFEKQQGLCSNTNRINDEQQCKVALRELGVNMDSQNDFAMDDANQPAGCVYKTVDSVVVQAHWNSNYNYTGNLTGWTSICKNDLDS